MKLLFIATAFVPAVLGLTINTPTGVVQCQPIMLTFGSGVPPYYVSAIPGGQVSAAALRTWDPTAASSITWNVDIASGTSLSFIVKDSTGAQAFSDSVTVQSSSDSSCLDGSSSASSRLPTATASFVSLQVTQSHATSFLNDSRLLAGSTTRAANSPAATTGIGSNTTGASQVAPGTAAARTTSAQGASSNTVSNTVSRASGGRRQPNGGVVSWIASAVALVAALVL